MPRAAPGSVAPRMQRIIINTYGNVAVKYMTYSGSIVGYTHGCTAVGDGNTSPTTKLYQFYHLLVTVQIFSLYLKHGKIQQVLKTGKVKDKVMANK